MDRSESNYLTIFWDNPMSPQAQYNDGFEQIKDVNDIDRVVLRIKQLSYTPVKLRVYRTLNRSLQTPHIFRQESGVPGNLPEILKEKLNEILAIPGVAVGLTSPHLPPEYYLSLLSHPATPTRALPAPSASMLEAHYLAFHEQELVYARSNLPPYPHQSTQNPMETSYETSRKREYFFEATQRACHLHQSHYDRLVLA